MIAPDWQSEDGSVRLYCGDCLKVLPGVRDEIDAVVADPPYGVNWNTDYTRFTTGFGVPRTNHRAIAGESEPFDPTPWLEFPHVCLFGANCFSNKLPCGTWLVWDKRFANGKAFLADAEVAWLNKGHGIYIKSVTCQGFVRPEKKQHPTQKPEAIMQWAVEKASDVGDLVCDPFMGSGTTGVACVNTGRKFIGIEIDRGYFDIAVKRISVAIRANSELLIPA